MNKCRAPLVPPLLVNNIFVLNCSEKAKHFIESFSQHCEIGVNSSVLSPINFHTTKRIDHIIIQNGEILPLIRNLNPHNSGVDGGWELASCQTRTKFCMMDYKAVTIQNLTGDTFVDDYIINYS